MKTATNELVSLWLETVQATARDARRVPKFMHVMHEHAEKIVAALVGSIARHCMQRASMEIHPLVNAIANVMLREGITEDRRASVVLAFNVVTLAGKMGWLEVRVTEDVTMVRMTDEFIVAMQGHWHLGGTLKPVMLECPRAHTAKRPGGYRDPKMRTGMSNGSWRQMRLAEVALLAGNRMQRVKWRIDKPIMRIAEWVLTQPVSVADRDRFGHDTVLAMAQQIPAKTPFYLPTFFEGSGRIFYESALSPQGNDLCRGLLKMSKSRKLNAKGMHWLKVHVANSWSGVGVTPKIDKAPFKDRVKWVDKNTDMILKVADDPKATLSLWWDGLGKGAQSFQCLAASRALARALKTGMCSLPVMLDQTTSNYGHAACMLKDPELARVTNLTKQAKFSDFHNTVVERLGVLIKGTPLNKHRLILLVRKLVKGPSMIAGYGGTPRGSAKHLLGKQEWATQGEKFIKVAERGTVPALLSDDPKQQFTYALMVANAIQQAVKDTAASAFVVTDLIRECVKRMKDLNCDPAFYSPTGVLVKVRNRKTEEARVAASEVLGGGSIKWRFYTDEYNWRKILTAFAPRFTHAHDASTLHLTIAACDFPTVGVHDCFGCHPNDMDKLYDAFRHGLVRTYSKDSLKMFCSHWDVPVKQGKFKIASILRANMLS